MAEFDNSAYIGPFVTEPTEASLDTIASYDRGLGAAGRAVLAKSPPSFLCLDQLKQAQLADGVAGSPVDLVAPYPMKLFRFDGGAEVFGAGLSALTYDIQVNRAGAGFVTVLDAATDIFAAGAGGVGSSAPEEDLEDIDAGDVIRVIWLATGGTADGALLRLWAKHR